jgi:hypothetical protein
MREMNVLLRTFVGGIRQLAPEKPAEAQAAGASTISRRQVLHGLGVLGAAALLTACAFRQPPAPEPGRARPAGGAPPADPGVAPPARQGNVMTGIDEVQGDGRSSTKTCTATRMCGAKRRGPRRR